MGWSWERFRRCRIKVAFGFHRGLAFQSVNNTEMWPPRVVAKVRISHEHKGGRSKKESDSTGPGCIRGFAAGALGAFQKGAGGKGEERSLMLTATPVFAKITLLRRGRGGRGERGAV